MKKNTIIASVVATFVATAASAGTIVAPMPDPVIMPTPVFATSYWDGFYAGAAAGWTTGDFTISPPGTPIDNDGYGYGGFLGYNYVMDGGFMIGGEVAASMFSIDGTGGSPEVDGTMFDAKLRVGFEVDRALVYVSGGYSMLTGEYNPGTVDIEGTGWNVGAGVDYLVTDSVFVGAEYVYRDMESSTGTPAWESTSHAFTVRAGIKF